MPTSSSAQPLMAFSSPLLSSVDRLLRGFDSRFSTTGLFSSLSRSQNFTDRLFNRRLSSLGWPNDSGAFFPREQVAPPLTHAESWVPSPASLTGTTGTRLPAKAPGTLSRPQQAVAHSVPLSLPMVPSASVGSSLPSVSTSLPSLPVHRTPTVAERALAALPELANEPERLGAPRSEELRGHELVAAAAPARSNVPLVTPETARLSAFRRSIKQQGSSD